jgi:hypothetical protein
MISYTIRRFASFVLAAVAAPAVAQLQQGGIKATVVNAAGKAVSGLYVSAVPLGPNAGASNA